jgi:hypothetical protein
MKRTLLTRRNVAFRPLLAGAGFSLLLTGCASHHLNQFVPEPAPETLRFEATGTAFLEEAGSLSNPVPLHNATFVESTASGFPADNATTAIQKELTALKAARYGAMAKLAEELDGLQVTRNARVQDMVFSGEEVAVTLSGIIQGASTVSEIYHPESEHAEVCLRIALDPNGDIIQQRATRIAPASIHQRKAEAETAARINATAALREQVGKTYVMQNVQVKDLQFASQDARLDVGGLLKNVQFSAPQWIGETQCEITAILEISPEEMASLEVKTSEVSKKEVCQ